MADESEGTVLLAGAANLAIAVAKCIAGLLSGSTALLAEAAHSVADTLNQVFLLTALKRSRKPADALHPFGYGMERYFWSLLAAVGIFVLGAGFSIAEGIRAVLDPEPVAALAVVYSVLLVSFIFEGISWLRAVRQVRREAHDQGVSALDHLKEAEPAVKTVAFEDSAALIGLVIAAVGVTLSAVTGEEFWDGTASIAIGLLLIGVAFTLGRDNKSMLIGQALPDDVQDQIRRLIADTPGIDEVVELLSLRLAPDQVLVVVRVDLDDSETTGAKVEQLAERIDTAVRRQFPIVRHLYLDPTPATSLDPGPANQP
ncbi:cation diffusion facilitator family transporter [Kribbella sp. VKM Ac-2568]|uniref:cation diffusion facilitator family transporter n=1 Tax=Kribbella sp. VKM Ac-2568 TaxID=2512219 RepID=UPI00104D9423|nr:cation diffusion facilitator family transporter [Kribbella sp. VKM Ac-2568]TCM51460.1 cation diffusion facilitator family transporter [Kribbella sp. VKM Ac-2568]